MDLNWLAYSVCETLGDKDWAKKLYEKAGNNPQNVRELCDLADSISETFGDPEWQIKVYKKAEGMAKEHSDFYELADSVCVKLGDKNGVENSMRKPRVRRKIVVTSTVWWRALQKSLAIWNGLKKFI